MGQQDDDEEEEDSRLDTHATATATGMARLLETILSCTKSSDRLVREKDVNDGVLSTYSTYYYLRSVDQQEQGFTWQ